MLGIEFTKEFIHIFSLAVQKNSVRVEKIFHLDMPQNGYTSGMLINNDHSISDLIADTLKENKIHDKKVIVSVSGVDCMNEEFSLPKDKPKNMSGMVEQELLKRRRLTAQYLFDYTEIGEDFEKPGFVKIRAALCPKTLVNNYYDVLKKAGLVPLGFDLINHSMEFLANKSGISISQEIFILACINHDEIHFTYCGRNEQPYYRHAFIKQEDMLDESMFVLSASSKFNLGLDMQDKLVETVIENITRLTRFHSQRHPEVPINGIRVYGDYDDISSLCERIQNAVGITTQPFNILSSITTLSGKGISFIKGSINVLGSVIAVSDNEQTYDFFKKLQDSKEEKGSNLFWIPTMIAIILAALVVCAYSFINTKNKELEADLTDIEAYVYDQNLQDAYDVTQDYLDDINSYLMYDDKVQIYIDTISNKKRFESEILHTIDSYVTDDVEITAMSFKNDAILLSCVSDTKYAPAEFTSSLSAIDGFSDVSYTGFQAMEQSEDTTYSFSVEIILDREDGDE